MAQPLIATIFEDPHEAALLLPPLEEYWRVAVDANVPLPPNANGCIAWGPRNPTRGDAPEFTRVVHLGSKKFLRFLKRDYHEVYDKLPTFRAYLENVAQDRLPVLLSHFYLIAFLGRLVVDHQVTGLADADRLPSPWDVQYRILYDETVYSVGNYQLSHLCGWGPFCHRLGLVGSHCLFELDDYQRTRDLCRDLHVRGANGEYLAVRATDIDPEIWRAHRDSELPHDGVWLILRKGEAFRGGYHSICSHDPPCI